MNTFTKWFLLNAVVVTACFLAEQKKLFSMMIKADSSYICISIMTLYVFISAFVGKLSYKADKTLSPEEKQDIFKKLDVGWFCAEHFFSLGLLGTVIGLCLATGSELSGSSSTKQIVDLLKVGLHTAYYTTVCGIVFSIPVQVQLMIVKYKLEK